MVYGDFNITRSLKLGPLSTSERTTGDWATGLGAGDEGTLVFDEDLNNLVFWDGSAWLEPMVANSASLFDLSDISPADFSGSGNYLVNVNSGANALEFSDPAVLVPNNQTSITFTMNGAGTGVGLSGAGNHNIALTTLSTDANNSLTTGTDGGLYYNADPLKQEVVADIAARDALTDLDTGDLAYVTDASADGTVTSGAALYVYNGSSWQKIAEFESMDVTIVPDNLDAVLNQGGTLGSAYTIAQGGNLLTFDGTVEASILQLGDTDSDTNKWTIQEDASGNIDFDFNAGTRLSVSETGAVTFNNAFTFPILDGSANQYLSTNGSGVIGWASPGGGFTSFDITDGTNTETIGDGQTVTYTGQNGVSAVVGATDTLTLELDIATLTQAVPDLADSVVYYDTSASGNKRETFSNILSPYISTF